MNAVSLSLPRITSLPAAYFAAGNGKRNPFPAIINGEDFQKPIFESAHMVLIMNADPVAPGHALVISKRPVQRLAELTPKEVADAMLMVQRYQAFWRQHPDNEGTEYDFSVWINDGDHAGQSVPHFHIQVAPNSQHRPLPDGAIRRAINPQQAGLPEGREGFKTRVKEINAHVIGDLDYLKQFACEHKLNAPILDVLA